MVLSPAVFRDDRESEVVLKPKGPAHFSIGRILVADDLPPDVGNRSQRDTSWDGRDR